MMTKRKFVLGGLAAILSTRKMPAIFVRSAIGGRTIVGSNHDDRTQYTAQDYIQDGLVIHFDAIENVEYGVHDIDSSEWVDLINGMTIALPSGTFWGDDFMVLPDETSHFSTASLYGTAMYFKECGAVTVMTLQEVIDFSSADEKSFPFAFECGYAGYLQYVNYYGTLRFENRITTSNSSSHSYCPPVVNSSGLTPYEANSLSECALWLKEDDQTHAYGWTRFNGDIMRLYDGGSISWFSTVNSDKWKRVIIRGSNLKRKSILVYNKILTDEERAWNLKVSKARFGV